MKLVDDWKTWPRRWSTWCELAAVSFFSYVAYAPDAVVQMWLILPEDVRATVDPDYIKWAGIAMIVIGSGVKIIEQKKLHGGDK